jgi:peroxiredoxin
MSLTLGDAIPHVALPDTDGRLHELDAPGAAATVVVFTCNHCPYALAWHDRIAAVARDYRERGVRVYAVNSNDATRYPRDSYEAMQERVAADGDWPMPYLHDESQEVARAFGARVTPDVFVFAVDEAGDDAGRLIYRGAPDADSGDPSLDAQWLRDALDDELAGGPVARPETEPVGCSVKWRL